MAVNSVALMAVLSMIYELLKIHKTFDENIRVIFVFSYEQASLTLRSLSA